MVSLQPIQNIFFHPVYDCMMLNFISDNFVDSYGSQAELIIPSSHFQEIEDGSQIKVNEILFTFKSTPLTSNDIEINDIAVMMQSLYYAILNNFYLSMIIDNNHSYINSSEIFIKTSNCNDNIYIDFIFNESNNYSLSSKSTIFKVKNNYEILINLNIGNNNCNSGYLQIPIDINWNCTQCSFDTYKIKKDIAPILQDSVYTPIPTIDPINLVTILHQRTNDVKISFAESYEEGNIFETQNANFESLKYINYKSIFNNDIKNHHSTSINQKYFTILNQGDEVYCCQHNWVHYYADAKFPIKYIKVKLSLYNKDGSNQEYMSNLNFESRRAEGEVLEIQIGLPTLADHFNIDNISNVDIYTVTTSIITITDQEIRPVSLSLHVLPCNSDIECVFLTSQGEFTSMPFKTLKEINIEGNKEYIDGCVSCDTSNQYKYKEITSQSSFKRFKLSTHDLNTFSLRFLEEFEASTERYLLIEGKFYYATIETNTIPLYNKTQKDTEIEFTLFGISTIYN